MSVGETRAIENMFEPWAPWDAVRVEPVALDLHHAVIQFCGGHSASMSPDASLRRDSSTFFSIQLSIAPSTGFQVQCGCCRLRSPVRSELASCHLSGFGQFIDKLSDIAGVSGEIEGE